MEPTNSTTARTTDAAAVERGSSLPVAPAVPSTDGTTSPPASTPAPFADPWIAADPTRAPSARPRFTLYRSRTDRMLGGVCGGLAPTLGVDAALLRIGLVALTVLGFGLGAVFYVAAWILAPVAD